jgi:hypothetical protein
MVTRNDKKTDNIFLPFFAVISAKAEQTRFVMSAPNAVEMGQQFGLTFTLNEQRFKPSVASRD